MLRLSDEGHVSRCGWKFFISRLEASFITSLSVSCVTAFYFGAWTLGTGLRQPNADFKTSVIKGLRCSSCDKVLPFAGFVDRVVAVQIALSNIFTFDCGSPPKHGSSECQHRLKNGHYKVSNAELTSPPQIKRTRSPYCRVGRPSEAPGHIGNPRIRGGTEVATWVQGKTDD